MRTSPERNSAAKPSRLIAMGLVIAATWKGEVPLGKGLLELGRTALVNDYPARQKAWQTLADAITTADIRIAEHAPPPSPGSSRR